MIRINLLAHRELARQKRREAFNLSLFMAAIAGVLLAGLVYLWFQMQISDQQDRNLILQTENSRLDAEIREIARIEEEIIALQARQQAVEELQADRNLPVYLLTELVKQMPDGVYLTSMKQESQSLTLQGVAQSNERVSELLRNLANNTPWLAKPELVEIVAGNVTLNARDQRRVSNFTMKVRLMRASEIEKTTQITSQSISIVSESVDPTTAKK